MTASIVDIVGGWLRDGGAMRAGTRALPGTAIGTFTKLAQEEVGHCGYHHL